MAFFRVEHEKVDIAGVRRPSTSRKTEYFQKGHTLIKKVSNRRRVVP